MKSILASLCLLAACSHSPLDPGAGSDPGTGTGTLMVNGTARAQANTPNATLDTQFTTELEVELSLGQQPLTAGTVTVTSHSGTATLMSDGNGKWHGSLANYDEVYQLDVKSGSDTISGVYVDGPDIHVFTAPAPGASLDASAMTALSWRRGSAAQTATVRVNGGGDGLTVSDSGSYQIPPLTLDYDKGQTKQNTISLTRTNSIAPKGAVPGSSFAVSVTNELDVVALACPSCP